MANDLKKFVNPRFTRTVDLVLLRRLLERHADNLQGLDLSDFGDDPDQTRRHVQDFFAGPEENYPEGLVADLHRIAELGNANGLELLLEQARRRSVEIAPAGDDTKQDPKHVALRLFLDHPGVFDAAADMLSYTTLSPGTAMFKRHRFEARIMTLLRRNGLVHDREPDKAAVAAE